MAKVDGSCLASRRCVVSAVFSAAQCPGMRLIGWGRDRAGSRLRSPESALPAVRGHSDKQQHEDYHAIRTYT